MGGVRPVEPGEFGLALFGPYLLAVELASIILLTGLIGAYHLGHRAPRAPGEPREEE
jgi:NADH-quinone oxidoreductase subunit J